jgi:UDP-N-acetyl-D-glucosamine dehydrogenase
VQNKIAVVGQGYVGLPLAVAAANAGFQVVGLDTNLDKVANLNNSISEIEDVHSNELKKIKLNGNYYATHDFRELSSAKIILVCVPTPLDINRQPDLNSLIKAVTNTAKNISVGTLVIIESTIAPGTTRNIIQPLIRNESKLGDENFTVAYSPERVDPVNSTWGIKNTPKLLSALTEEGYRLAFNFYSKFVNTIIKCDSIEVAEMAKLLENSFRLINISFINEIAMYSHKLGIDVNQVIKSASTKPFGFMPFYPSLGIGGHCIPVDPIYLANAAKTVGAPTRLIELADQINQELPEYFVSRAEEKIGDLKNKRVLVIGIAYKPDVADVRETPVENLIIGLKSKGAQVFWHDDLVREWNGEKSVAISNSYDLAIIATPHSYLDLAELESLPILNTRGSTQ